MKLYYTLTQDFIAAPPEIGPYLRSHGIKYNVGGDMQEELAPFGYKVSGTSMVLVYVVLIEEYELSAIFLQFNNIQLIRNRKFVDIKNKLRKFFKWFIK